jgi:amino acid permease
MVVLVPFCFLRKLDSLKYTSAFSLCAVVYLLFVVLGFYFMPLETMSFPRFEDLIWIKFSPNVLKKLPIFVFAFTCHQNVRFAAFLANSNFQIFSIHNELENNSSRQIDKVIGRSIGVAFTVYQTIGVIGYLTFGDSVGPNIIAMCKLFDFTRANCLGVQLNVPSA